MKDKPEGYFWGLIKINRRIWSDR